MYLVPSRVFKFYDKVFDCFLRRKSIKIAVKRFDSKRNHIQFFKVILLRLFQMKSFFLQAWSEIDFLTTCFEETRYFFTMYKLRYFLIN